MMPNLLAMLAGGEMLWIAGGVTGLMLLLGVAIAIRLNRRKRAAQRTAPAGAAGPEAVPPPSKTEPIPRQCPRCGTRLRGDLPEGLCPACLLQHGIATDAGIPADQARFVPPDIAELSTLFPQLEILELVGKGGMGAVYKARQPALDRFVALKILAPRPGNELDFGSRFTREARALAKLSHPNIVAVFDFGTVTRTPASPAVAPPAASRLSYFIMEYVDGPNLRQVQQAGKLAPREALEIIPQICAALQFAHDEGIVHRDIKPENVLLDKKGRVKIADFGLAKILGQETGDARLTGARDVMGTPHYMAPEQVERPQDVDHRADIFSLGVVFYEMLTGELPLGKFAPPSQKVQVDVRLDEVVLRALEKEPSRRYQQASQLKTELETVSVSASGRTPPRIPAPRSRITAVHWMRGLKVAAVMFLVVLTVSVAVAVLMSNTFVGTARILVRPQSSEGPLSLTLANESQKLQSAEVLGHVAKALNLPERWGRKYAKGKTLSESVTLDLLRRSIHLETIRDSSVISISFYSDSADSAAAGANQIVSSYRELHPESDVALVDSATPPRHPVKPNRILIGVTGVILGLFLAGLTGLATALVSYARSASRGTPPPPSQPQSIEVPSAFLTAGNVGLAVLLALVGWAAHAFGVFFNALFLFLIAALLVYVARAAWALFRGTVEYRFWSQPFAPGLRRHSLAVANGWLFWVASILVLELCIVPAQFTPGEYRFIRILFWSAAFLLMLLELIRTRRVYVATNLVFAIGTVFMASHLVLVYGPAKDKDPEAVVLDPPFRGEWVIVNGGHSSLINPHFSLQNQRHAMDLARVVNGRDKVRQSDSLDAYAAWGEPVFAPANGTVVAVENAIDDNRPGNTDDVNLAGNHVVLEIGKSRYVLLAHLQKGSLRVGKGDPVRTGEWIARCGNSGNTTQPHLHLQVQNRPDLFAEDIRTFPIRFDAEVRRSNRRLQGGSVVARRNDLIHHTLAFDEGVVAKAEAPAAMTNSAPVLEPAGDRAPVTPPPAPVVAAYQDISIELLGVSSEARGDDFWWHPGGGALTNELIGNLHRYPGSMAPRILPPRIVRTPFTERATGAYRFAFRMHRPGAARFEINGHDAPYTLQPVFPQPGSRRGIESVWIVRADLPAELREVTCTATIAGGPWFVDESIPEVRSGRASAIRIVCGGLRWNVTAQLRESPGEVRLTGSHPLYWSEGWDHQLVLLSGSGSVYSYVTNESVLSYGAITLNRVNETFKNITLEDVADVRFRIRPMQRFAFENVSLLPGHLTDVVITNTTSWKSQPTDFKVERLGSVPAELLEPATNSLAVEVTVDPSTGLAVSSPTALERDLEARWEAAREILGFSEKDKAMAAIARDAAAAGHLAVVRKALGQMTSFSSRDEAIRQAARCLVQAGLRGEAIEIAKTITSFSVRDTVLRELANQP